VEEKQLTDFRYRGHGNPGPTTATLSDGNTRQISYLELWEDETSWALPHRCKICPDAIGMAADIIAADCWPGGAPTGEDAGENAVAARSGVGEDLLKRAFVAGALTRGNTIGIDDLNTFQPHQIRKREAVWARLAGHRAAMRGEDAHGTLTTQDLGIDRIARDQQRTRLLNEARGTRRRVAAGRAREPKPVASRQMAHSQPNI
ncbi:MAG: Coenzyme F420 hydrogenase/dehydrogenase, beta subunit C-terminal domain, partial [Planctomycetota bacterium]